MQLVPVQASTDQHLIALWLRAQNSPNTRRGYRTDVALLLAHVGKPLASVTLSDLQSFADAQCHLSPASLARRLSSIKSLLSFAHRIGYLAVNIGVVVRLPAVKDTLAERLMSEAEVHALLRAAQGLRDGLLVKLVYAVGLRISEACSLKSRDLRTVSEGKGSLTIFGKGGQTRTIAMEGALWAALLALRSSDPDAPVFVSRKGGCLDVSAVHRIVKACAERAGLSAAVSTHWLRHAHVSHALDHGAPVHLVQATVGHASLATTSRYAHVQPAQSSASYLAFA